MAMKNDSRTPMKYNPKNASKPGLLPEEDYPYNMGRAFPRGKIVLSGHISQIGEKLAK